MAVTKLAVAEKHMSPYSRFGDLLATVRPFVIKDGRISYPVTAFGTDVCGIRAAPQIAGAVFRPVFLVLTADPGSTAPGLSDHPQGAIAHPGLVVMIGKGKAVPAVEPIKLAVEALGGWAKYQA